jgi:TPR repeat protein
VDAAPANADDTGRDGVIGNLIEGCFLDNRTCRKALPAIAGDCNDGQTDSSPAACRNAGYILDVGLGMPASATGAADYYRKGCALKDEVSCVRFATLQSQGRGVPRDAAAAVRVLDAACGKDLQEACFRLGVHLSSTKNAADLARARVVLTASCKAEFAESCTWLKKLPP